MLQRNILYVAKKYITWCKDKRYMLQRQNLYVIKTNLYVIKTKFICYRDKLIWNKAKNTCYKDKVYMLQRESKIRC